MFRDLNDSQKKRAMTYGYFALFAERENVQEAYNLAIEVADNCLPADKAAVTIAIHVLMNTTACLIAREVPNPRDIAKYMKETGDYKDCENMDFFPSSMAQALENLYVLETEVL